MKMKNKKEKKLWVLLILIIIIIIFFSIFIFFILEKNKYNSPNYEKLCGTWNGTYSELFSNNELAYIRRSVKLVGRL